MKILKFYIVIVFYILTYSAISQDIVFNEIMSSNSSTSVDLDGDYPDWIELYNTTDAIINLQNFSLSDDENDLTKWVFPAVEIPSNGFLLIFASGKNLTGSELHTNFKINQAGEALFLLNPQNEIMSSTPKKAIPTEMVFCAIQDGNDQFVLSNTPTPNISNYNSHAVICSKKSGYYPSDISVSLTASNDNLLIYYTLNGETPSTNSSLFTSEIDLSDKSTEPNVISMIPTTPLTGPSQLNQYIWKEPSNINKCNVLRYASFLNGVQQSQVYSKSFFINPELSNRYNFEVTSLITDSLNLFDYSSGIYIPGQFFDENGWNWFPTGNYNLQGSLHEKEIHLTHFNSAGEIMYETDAGMRMRGISSTATPQKSFNVFFRSDYGLDKIDLPLFSNKNNTGYQRLIYRNSGNDNIKTHFRDVVLQEILSSFDLELQQFEPNILFINGEYWGIHNLREKFDNNYFETNFSIDSDDLNIMSWCGSWEHGTTDHYD